MPPKPGITSGRRRNAVSTMEESRMQWTTPSYTDVRLGFEIVMYVATR
jgi:pyrroloquinoline quinone biosynthesis protein A